MSQLDADHINKEIVQIKKQTLLKQEQVSTRRRHQPFFLYFLILTIQQFTFYAVLLLALPDRTTTYIIYISLTCFRVVVSIFNSWYLIGFGWPMFHMYFMLDNLLLAQLASDVTYILLNYDNPAYLAVPASSMYPVLVFFMTGNIRVMLTYCNWKRWQVIVYKINRLAGALFYLIYGSIKTVDEDLANRDLFLLFIFTTFGYLAQAYFTCTTIDAADNLLPNYLLKDQQCDHLQLEQR